jgi:hypothetical protein
MLALRWPHLQDNSHCLIDDIQLAEALPTGRLLADKGFDAGVSTSMNVEMSTLIK